MATNSPHGHRSAGKVIAGITTIAAAAFLLVSGVVTVIQGISALSNDRMVVAVPDYVYRFNSTAWGWIHIILGILVVAVALGLFSGVMWARVGAIVIASLSIVTMFLWLPHSPVWAIVVIALDIVVIWGVATWENPRTRTREMPAVLGGLPAQREPGRLWPEPSEWLPGFPSWAPLRPVFGGQPIRLEDEMKDGRYQVRAELPGIDAAKDVDITARDGVLTIRAHRSGSRESDGRSEFSYGSLVRSVSLPPGANEDDITATYDKGILTVSMGVSEPGRATKRVQVQSAT